MPNGHLHAVSIPLSVRLSVSTVRSIESRMGCTLLLLTSLPMHVNRRKQIRIYHETQLYGHIFFA